MQNHALRWFVVFGLLLAGCTDDGGEDTDTAGDGDGDMEESTGDGDGDPTTGDGDGDPTTGDGDGDPTTGDGDGDGDGDPTTGDGDGDPTTGDGDGDGDPNACAPVGQCAVEPESDAFSVFGLALEGDCLSVEVGYSGGCETHEFSSCWDQSFAESEPVQAWLWVDHEANDDPCEAYIQEIVEFDLTPLREAWQDAYQADSGTITVHVGDQSIQYSF